MSNPTRITVAVFRSVTALRLGVAGESRAGGYIWLLATSLFGDVAAALREHGSATLDEHCCYFRRPDCVLVGGHRELRSRGITDCPVTAITVTRCNGGDSTCV